MNISFSSFLPRRALMAGAALVAALGTAQAQTSPGLPLWELGVLGLGVSQQAYPGSDQRINRGLALPYLVYRGDVLRADRETVGLRAIKTPTFELDVGLAGSFGSNSDRIKARQGMRDLGTLVEVGPRLKWKLGSAAGGNWQAKFPLRAVFDLSDSFAHRGLSFAPELVYERRSQGGWRYNVSVGAIVGDSKLANTFYGVSGTEATLLRPAYTAQSGLVGWRLGTSVSRNLTPDWVVFGFARIDSVSGAANRNSPLIRQTTGTTFGLGLSYTWMRSTERVSD
ncbi:MAG TPA: MipA/OmpV family protein [Burkholderiaceae bacterium]|nr:MipA/OmpV family protein [Burkholderiaceae bacterium]